MPSSKFSKSIGKSTTDYIKNDVFEDNHLVENFINKIRNATDDIDVGTHGYFKTEYLLKVFKDKKTKDDKFNFIKKTIPTGSNIEEDAIKTLFIENYIKDIMRNLYAFTDIDFLSANYRNILCLINLKLFSYENTNGKIHWDVSNFIEYVDYQVLLDLCEENTILSTGAQVETGFQVSIEDPIVWKPAIYNYAIACDIFPQMSEILDLPYLLRCYDTCEVPKAEKAMFIPELY